MSTHRLRDQTLLVLPVPEVAEQWPGAHLTLMDPFLPRPAIDEGVLAELRELFAQVVPFGYVLGDAARFPSGEAYLPPQPGAVFRRLMGDLRRTFPEVVARPDGLHGAIPHVALPEEAVAAVTTPLEAHAREAVLLGDPDGEARVLEVFRFGTSAA